MDTPAPEDEAIGFTVFFHPNPIEAFALNLLTVFQRETLENYRAVCARCGMPMIENMQFIPEIVRMVPYYQCPLCKGLDGISLR